MATTSTGDLVKFIHIEKKADFTAALQSTYKNGIVFIAETRELYTHDKVYMCNDETTVWFSQYQIFGSDTLYKSISKNGTLVFLGVDGITITCGETGIAIGHTNKITAGKSTANNTSVDFNGTINIPNIEYDANGHIKSVTNTAVKLPASPANTDTTYKLINGTAANSSTAGNGAFINLVDSNNAVKGSVLIKQGTNVQVTGATDGTITISATDTNTHQTSKNIVAGSATATDNASVSTSANGVWLNHLEDNNVTSKHNIKGAGSVTVGADASGNITITGATYTNNTGTVTNVKMTVPTGLTVNPTEITTSGTFNIAYANGYAIPTTTEIDNIKSDASLGKAVYNASSNFAPKNSPALTGTPTAPTATVGTNTQQIATTAFVKAEINNILSANDAMVFKGVVNANSELPSIHEAGWTYKIGKEGDYAKNTCEIGDMIICIADGSTANDDHWAVIQTNIDGAVTGPKTSVVDRVATFANTNGNIIKDSGFTIGTSVPAGALFTDTKVTSVDNHYPPAENTGSQLTASGGATLNWEGDIVTGVKRDAKGHVVGLVSAKLPALPSFSHYTTHLYAGTGSAANAATTNGNTKLSVADDNTVNNSITIAGTGATTVTSDASGKITIDSSNTTYTNGTGLKLDGTTFNHTNSVTARTTNTETTRTLIMSQNPSFKIPNVQYDNTGHITKLEEATITLPKYKVVVSKSSLDPNVAETVQNPFINLVAGETVITSVLVLGESALSVYGENNKLILSVPEFEESFTDITVSSTNSTYLSVNTVVPENAPTTKLITLTPKVVTSASNVRGNPVLVGLVTSSVVKELISWIQYT